MLLLLLLLLHVVCLFFSAINLSEYMSVCVCAQW